VSKKKLSIGLILSLAIGFAGLAVLSVPELTGASKIQGLAVILLLIAPISWAVGTIIQRRHYVAVSSIVSSGYQQIFGGIGFLIAALIFHEQFLISPKETAWLAWGYLVVFGSLLAYTSFVQALRLLPSNIVMTYAYVNPVIAVFLGWFFLKEKITPWTVAGMICIVLSVVGVLRNSNGGR
jgi:drug/metabolite transporter (DMT)-like permease